MDKKTRACWYRLRAYEGKQPLPWKTGEFHQFTQCHTDYGEFGPGQWPGAIVETEWHAIVVVNAIDVNFGTMEPREN